MKKIKLNEVMEKSSPEGIVIHKYKKMRTLQRAISLLLDSPIENIEVKSLFQMDKNKVYYVQDYINKEFYYQCSEEYFSELKENIDDYLDSLIGSLAGVVDAVKGRTTEYKGSKELMREFKKKINSNEVKITEV